MWVSLNRGRAGKSGVVRVLFEKSCEDGWAERGGNFGKKVLETRNYIMRGGSTVVTISSGSYSLLCCFFLINSVLPQLNISPCGPAFSPHFPTRQPVYRRVPTYGCETPTSRGSAAKISYVNSTAADICTEDGCFSDKLLLSSKFASHVRLLFRYPRLSPVFAFVA